MTAKQYLGRVRRVDREISALLRMVEKTRESVTSITQKSMRRSINWWI